jgi:signal transduction histidine kinase
VQSGLTVELDDRLDGDLPPGAIQATAYRIIQEALTNVVRHSAASHATITLERDADELVVRVADDGSGIPDDAIERGGLRGMRERAELIGGTLTVAGSDAGGTGVTAHLPWRVPA